MKTSTSFKVIFLFSTLSLLIGCADNSSSSDSDTSSDTKNASSDNDTNNGNDTDTSYSTDSNTDTVSMTDSDTGISNGGSCYIDDVPGYESCIDYIGSSYSGSSVQMACSTGIYYSGHCPTDSCVAKCVGMDKETAGNEFDTYYYYAEAIYLMESSCTTNGGTWQNDC